MDQSMDLAQGSIYRRIYFMDYDEGSIYQLTDLGKGSIYHENQVFSRAICWPQFPQLEQFPAENAYRIL